MQPTSEVNVQQQGNVLLIQPRGRLGMTEMDSLADALDLATTNMAQVVALDFTDVDFVNSRALGMIMATRSQVERRGGRMLLGNMNYDVLKVFQLSRLDTLLPIIEDLDECLDCIMQNLKPVDEVIRAFSPA